MMFHAKSLARFLRNEHGGIAVVGSVLILMMITTMGVSVDIARAFMVKSKMQAAVEAAALGAASSASSIDPQTEMKNIFAANFPTGYMGATTPNLNIQASPQNDKFNVQAQATLPYVVMKIMGFKSTRIAYNTEVSRSVKIAEKREIIIATDISGNMAWQPHRRSVEIPVLETTKKGVVSHALKLMVEGLIGENSNKSDRFYFSILPYSSSVDPGAKHEDWLRPAEPYAAYQYPKSYIHSLATRNLYNQAVGNDTLLHPPNSNRFYPESAGLFYPDFYRNGLFTHPSAREILFAEQRKNTLIHKFDDMKQLDTLRNKAVRWNVGMYWARMLATSQWQGVWEKNKPSLPSSSNKKTIIYIAGNVSDAANPTADDPMPQWAPNNVYLQNRMVDIAQFKTMCDLAKAEGNDIIVIDFIPVYSVPNSSNGSDSIWETDSFHKSILKECASSPENFYQAKYEDEMYSIAKQIVDRILFDTITQSGGITISQ